jgi:RNA polymerase sigma-70 factor (ECF subfamily)
MGSLFSLRVKPIDEFEQLVCDNLDGLYGAALRYTRDRGRAEDLVQDTVVRALRFRDKFEKGTNFRAWIFTILTRTFIGAYRRQKQERELLDGVTRNDVVRELHSEQNDLQARRPEESYLDRLLSDDILKALDDLPEDFRTVVVLCDIAGLGYKEIAEAVGSPIGTVMSRLYRGRRILEAKLLKLAVEQGVVRAATKNQDSGEVVDLARFRRRKGG